MRLILISTVTFCIAFITKFLNARDSLKDARLLLAQYEKWIEDPSSQPPSNAVFIRMFKDIYHQTTWIKDFWVRYPGVLNARQADLVASFPSTHTALVNDYFQILRNFVDHYQLQYRDALSFKYWFNCVVFLPQKALTYLGLNSGGPLGKISNIIYWALSFVWAIFESRLIDLIKQILNLK